MLHGEFNTSATLVVGGTEKYKRLAVRVSAELTFPVTTNNKVLDEKVLDLLIAGKTCECYIMSSEITSKDNNKFDVVNLIAVYKELAYALSLASEDNNFKGFYRSVLVSQCTDKNMRVPF